jgi:cell division septation protein DedD
MSEKPAKPAASKPTAKPAASKPTSSRKPTTKRRKLDQGEISVRAYFIQLEEGGSDQLGNWLRAERELMTA